MRESSRRIGSAKRALAMIGALTVANLALPAVASAAPAAGCSAFLNSTVSGGYKATLACNGIGLSFIDGLGTTLTDAGEEARALARIALGGGDTCSAFLHATAPGGYNVTLTCVHTGLVSGSGTTLTDASRAARASI
ncbi:hypothetical protein SAMN04489729_0208 [Amycolatopsis lurida]|uniref:Uncharacterized protein n=1 Tax=Amycolatopsis lurida NRRL 2430 TaxID=1460371 RepID=A0A2P2FPS5_AMYLU|nr:hypothetical protein [Amycolatopsis lurida]KFU78719.1 hypothetical protein BB31_23550 [Amycolatopsis lurida NRRL 2430]SEB32152.1 hypothetical protein SAMN04489729_0208 [Amycolatopsis lurida]